MWKNIVHREEQEFIVIDREGYTKEEIDLLKSIFGLEKETNEIRILSYNIDYFVDNKEDGGNRTKRSESFNI